MANDLQYPYSIDFECDTTILSCYIDYLGEIDRTMKRQIEFLKILPEIQKAYGSLFIYNNKHCEMTKDAGYQGVEGVIAQHSIQTIVY